MIGHLLSPGVQNEICLQVFHRLTTSNSSVRRYPQINHANGTGVLQRPKFGAKSRHRFTQESVECEKEQPPHLDINRRDLARRLERATYLKSLKTTLLSKSR